MVKRHLAIESEMDMPLDVRAQIWEQWMEIWIKVESIEKKERKVSISTWIQIGFANHGTQRLFTRVTVIVALNFFYTLT